MTVAISMRFPLSGSVYPAFWNILMALIIIRNIGWSSVRGRVIIGIRLRLQTIVNNCRIIISHFRGEPIFLFRLYNPKMHKIPHNQCFVIRLTRNEVADYGALYP